MEASLKSTLESKVRGKLSRASALPLIALAAIVILAAGLRFANLNSLGYVNHYYSAAVESMLQSWHNFFFVAAEPGGSVSVDKPPVGLWLQTISAYFFGVNTFGILFPQLLAGILSVVVVYYLVKRSFGEIAGLTAALVLAVTPVVVATDRNNTIDSPLILTLLLAAWAFIKATESGRLRYLLVGATLVGIGFNIKMLEAYLPVPAFFALYFLGAPTGLGRKFVHLTLAGLLMIGISLSWAVVVDLTPADQRPYVGSTTDNSELSLILGYNGVDRLLGRNAGRSSGTATDGAQNGTSGAGGAFPGGQLPGPGGRPQGRPGQDGGQLPPDGGPGPGDGGQFPPGGGPGGGRGPGGSDLGQIGVLRLFTPPLSKEIGWLLPFGVISALVLLFSVRLKWPIAPEHQALVLWGGWLVTEGVFFSIAGFFHEYYLSTMGASLAALVGIGLVQFWRLSERHRKVGVGLLLAAVALTLGAQWVTAHHYTTDLWWLPIPVGLFGVGAGLLLAAILRNGWGRLAQAGLACGVAAMLITPGIWSGLTVLNVSSNQSLPSAYNGQKSTQNQVGGLQYDQNLLSYLEAGTQGSKYLMAVPSSMQGADYVLATGRPVLYMGGFMGQDQVLTTEELAQLVNDGELRYIYWGGRGGFGNQQSSISAWVASHCRTVSGFETTTQNFGAPDGTSGGDGRSRTNMGAMQVSLYDCQK